MPQTQTAQQLKREIAHLEMQKKKQQEQQQLQKKLKQMQFENTTLGKVTGGISRFGESLTRPAQRDASGKPIEGTGGVGAKLMGIVTKMGSPVPQTAKQKVQMHRQARAKVMQPPHQSALEGFAEFMGTPQTTAQPQRVSRAKARIVRQKQQKPFNMDDVIKGLPQ